MNQRARERATCLAMVGVAVLLGATCGQPGDDDRAAVAAINSQTGCFTAAADAALTGSGTFVTSATYNHSTCLSAYLVDMTNYASGLNIGSQVSYSGARPTTASACDQARLTAYVWRRESSGSGTFLSSVERRGVWGPDIKGVNRCKLATINLDREIPAYVGDGQKDYRIALQARVVDATGATILQPIAFAAIGGHARTPLSDMANLSSYRTELINSANSGTPNPSIQALMARKGTYAIDTICRTTRLDRTLSQFTNQALVRAGASAADTTKRDTGLTTIIDALCTTAGTADNLSLGIRTYARAMLDIRDEIQTAYPTMPNGATFAASTMAQANTEALGVLIMRCGLKPQDVLPYLLDGTLPAGKTADNLLLASCSGTSPASVALSLGVGLDFPGQTKAQARQTLTECLIDTTGTDRCNDPRAEGANPEVKAGDPPPHDESTCKNWEEQRPCNADEQVAWDKEQADKKTRETTVDEITAAAKGTDSEPTQAMTDAKTIVTYGTGAYLVVAEVAIKQAAGTIAEMAVTAVTTALGPIVKGFALGMATCYQFPTFCDHVIGGPVRTIQAAAVAAGNETRRNPCMFSPTTGPGFCPPSSNQMCNPAYDVGGWYDTDRPSSRTEISKTDRFQHCMCQFLDSNYAGVTNGLVPAGCPTAEEKLRQDCITTPDGPDDRPRPECLRQLSPPADLHTWQIRVCNKARCPSGQVTKTMDDGSCSCTIAPPIDVGQGLPCRLGTTMMCDGSGVVEACGCPPLLTGVATPPPIGNDPQCRYQTDDASWPGNIDSFAVLSPNDVFVHQHTATERFAMLRPNRTLASPTIFRNSLTAVPQETILDGASLRIKTLVTKAPPAGSTVDLKVYITSRDPPAGIDPFTHQLLGQVRLNALTPGTPTNVDVPLNGALIDRAFAGRSFRLDYSVEATGGYSRFVGIGSQSFVGATTPVASPVPICPRPDPTSGFTVLSLYNPISVAAGGTPTQLAPITFSNFTLALIPDRIPVIRALSPAP